MTANVIARTPSAYAYPLLIKNMLEKAVASSPEQEIIYADQFRFTYKEMRERVGRLASGLAGLGVKPGDTVAVMDWDTHRYLECFYGIPMMGAVLHMVNVRLSPDQVLYTINHAQDDVILVNAEFLPLLEAIQDKIDTVKKIVLLNDTGETPKTTVKYDAEYEDMLRGANPDYEFPELDEDTRATTFYTTGTTGLPKGVYFSHRQLVLHTMASELALANAPHGSLEPDDVYMPITPMFHVHAWGVPYVATNMGVKQVYPGRYIPERLLQLFIKEKVTFSHCVPTIMQMLLSSPDAAKVDLSGWKVIIGGSALPQALAKAAMERGIDIFTGYGMSETCPILTISFLQRHMLDWDIERQVEQRCKTGRPVPLVQIRVVDGDMNDLPHDGKSQGEVVVRAPWLTQGYLHDPDNSEKLWEGGWLHTGDIGVIDPDGYLRITDRLNDLIKSGGEWISSIELEGLILKVPGVAEAAVVGVPDQRWGERPLALVVAKAGETVTPEAVRSELEKIAEQGRISKYAVPERIELVDALPKTRVDKITKKVMRAEHA